MPDQRVAHAQAVVEVFAIDDVGVGLRLDLPIGPLRIDYGIPLEKGPYKDAGSGKFNFNVGYQF